MIYSYTKFIKESQQTSDPIDPIMLKLLNHAMEEDIVSFVEVLAYEMPKDRLIHHADRAPT